MKNETTEEYELCVDRWVYG